MPVQLPIAPAPLPEAGLRGLLRAFGSPDEFGNPPEPVTGRIMLRSADGREGHIYLTSGRVYSIHYTGFQPPLARRLRSLDTITQHDYEQLAATTAHGQPAVYDEAAIIAHTGVDPETIENITRQMLLSSLTLLYTWPDCAWTWEDGQRTSRNTISALEPTLLVAAADERLGQWNALQRNYPEVTMPEAVPQPGPEHNTTAGHPETRAVLALVDGTRTNRDIASTVALTRFELAGRLAAAISDDQIIYQATTPHEQDDPWGLGPEVELLAALEEERAELAGRLADLDGEISRIRNGGRA